MPKFECKSCDYSTTRSSDLERHKMTKKHIANIELALEAVTKQKNELVKLKSSSSESYKDNPNDEIINVLLCKFCNKKFSHKQSKYRHEKLSCKKNMFDDYSDRDISKFIQYMIDKDKEILKLHDIIATQASVSGKSASTLSYIVKHFNKAPPIKKLENNEAIKLLEYDVPENYTSADMFVYKYKSKILHEHLGKIIVNEYKTKNPGDQSFWNSDSARLSFIVRQAINLEGEWIADKSGLKIKNLIVSPMLEIVKETMKKYVKEKGKLIENGNESIDLLDDMRNANEIIAEIAQGYLHKEILKFISPHFNLDIKK